MVYKTFSASPELGSLDRETHDFWSDLHPLRERAYATHALERSDASDRDRDAVSGYFFARTGRLRVVDKNNQNGLCVPYLHALFPDAQFVYVKRSPGDNIHSLIEGWGKADEFATWSTELPADVRVDRGRYTRWCFFLFEGWRNYLESPIEEVCAAQYQAMNRAILDARSAIPKVALDRDRLRRTGERSGLRVPESVRVLRTRVRRGARGTLRTVLQRPYNAFSEIKVDKWREQKNRERIERVLPSVRETAREMGYAA